MMFLVLYGLSGFYHDDSFEEWLDTAVCFGMMNAPARIYGLRRMLQTQSDLMLWSCISMAPQAECEKHRRKYPESHVDRRRYFRCRIMCMNKACSNRIERFDNMLSPVAGGKHDYAGKTGKEKADCSGFLDCTIAPKTGA